MTNITGTLAENSENAENWYNFLLQQIVLLHVMYQIELPESAM